MISINLLPKNLRCEYLPNPLGLDISNPRLSWILESKEKNQQQTSYQILVASDPKILKEDKGDLWDSGKVDSDSSIHIEYNGSPLKSNMNCYWKVRVWNKEYEPSDWAEPAMWSTGLLDPDDWEAKWIGEPRRKLPIGKLNKYFRKKRIDPSPLIRKSFNLKGKVKRVILYATALGVYELYINGKKL